MKWVPADGGFTTEYKDRRAEIIFVERKWYPPKNYRITYEVSVFLDGKRVRRQREIGEVAAKRLAKTWLLLSASDLRREEVR